MNEEIKMSDAERNIRASAVMDFVDMIRGAYDSGFIDNHPTNYDIYRSAQMHVKDRYGVETDNWDDELAKESRFDSYDRLTQENQRLREALERLIKTSDSNEEQLASELCEAYWPSSALKYAQQLLTELKGGEDE